MLMMGIGSLVAALAFAAAPVVPAAQPDSPTGPVAALLQQESPLDAFHIDLAQARRFYALRGWTPAWTNPGEEGAAQLAIRALSESAAEGLSPDDYHLGDLARLARLPEKRMEYDILLSASLMHYESDVRNGRVRPEAVDSDIWLQNGFFDAAAETQAALEEGRFAQFLETLPPAHPEYRRLKKALQEYRRIAADGGWPVIPETGTIDLDTDDARIAILRARLAAEHFLPAPVADDPGNAQLREALRRYQTENGLTADGRAGTKTLASLNVSVAQRISQIIANMERWRWMPRVLGARYIAVNAADASLVAVKDGSVVLESRVIVGKPSSRTPIFAAAATGVTVNPFWNVPAPIARREILPRARRNPGYLARNRMFIEATGQVRQMPGPHNSLGLVKLELPNHFNVYLHDTPARALFARDDRFFSHGCIRVEQIRPVASFAMTGDPAAAIGTLDAQIAAGETRTIPLDRPMPIYVLYWTAIANQDGRAGFRHDVYGRDQRLLAALAGQHLIGRVAMNTRTFCGPTAG